MPVLVKLLVFSLTCVTVDVDLDLQMQVVVSHLHLYHTTDLALKSNL